MDLEEAPLKAALETALKVVSGAFLDEKQFYRYLVKTKGEEELQEREFRKIDTKAMKELTSVLKELQEMLMALEPAQEDTREEPGVRVIFEAGEEGWNE